jgi:arginine decarboxylase
VPEATLSDWSPNKSVELYGLDGWGSGAFAVNAAGHVAVRPHGDDGPEIDLLSLIDDLQRGGLRTPILLRFSDILANRIGALAGAFASAISEYEYAGRWRGG